MRSPEMGRWEDGERSARRQSISLPLVRTVLLLLSSALPLFTAACTDAPDSPDGRLRLDTERRDPERMLRFYFGSYLGPGGGDAVEAGLLHGEGQAFTLDPAALPERWRPALEEANANGDGTLDWDELSAFFMATYNEARALPPTLDAFREAVPYAADSAWFTVEIDGVMTSARRRVFVPLSAMRAALVGYRANGDRLLYPVGTAMIGEHWLDGERAETTLMQKRPDGFWDFWVYDAAGALADATSTPPRALRSPVQCAGCHFGDRAFEPEKSFPAPAPPGPYGPRTLHAGPEMRNADVVAFFDEHAKRSDTVLGVYNTLFISKLLADRAAGRLAPEDAALLDGLRLGE